MAKIVSNLRWTQAIYDQMKADETLKAPDPLDEDDVAQAAKGAIQSLLDEEFIVHTDLIGEEFQPLLAEVKSLTASEEGIRSILKQADDEAKTYYGQHIDKKAKAEAKGAK